MSDNKSVPPPGSAKENRPQDTGKAVNETAKRDIVDSIDISDDARAHLAELADQTLEAERAEAARAQSSREDRLAQIRERIDSGYYDRPEIDEAIADKLLDDLDL